MLFFSLCILPCDNPRAVSQFLFFYQIRFYLSSLSINHKLLIIILLPIILNLLKFFQLFLCRLCIITLTHPNRINRIYIFPFITEIDAIPQFQSIYFPNLSLFNFLFQVIYNYINIL